METEQQPLLPDWWNRFAVSRVEYYMLNSTKLRQYPFEPDNPHWRAGYSIHPKLGREFATVHLFCPEMPTEIFPDEILPVLQGEANLSDLVGALQLFSLETGILPLTHGTIWGYGSEAFVSVREIIHQSYSVEERDGTEFILRYFLDSSSTPDRVVFQEEFFGDAV